MAIASWMSARGSVLRGWLWRCAALARAGVLLEADAAAARLARTNCARNGLDGRVRVVEADLFDKPLLRSADLAFESASLVISNPPFYSARRSSGFARSGTGLGPHPRLAYPR